ncbi:MAG: GAF domain-containing protein [Planctomycetota bacterium]
MLDPLTVPLNPSAIAGSDPLHRAPRLAPPAGSIATDTASSAVDAAAESHRASNDLRIQAVLRGAARGLGFAAAELWTLDTATSSLGRRAAWDLAGADEPPRRSLAEAEADIAALSGGAVVIEQPEDAEPWALHRPMESAVGVPVASADTIHGVLWLVGIEPRRIADETVELAEIIAGRLALEIETEQPRVAVEDTRVFERETEAVALLPELPNDTPQLGELQLAGRTFNHGAVALHDWEELPDGRLMALSASIVDSPGDPSESAVLAAQSARVAARTLAASAADAGELLTRVNESLFGSTQSAEGVAMAVALIDQPEDAADAGEPITGTLAAAGPAGALRVRAAETTAVLPDAAPLGWDEQAAYPARPFELQVRERLVLVAGDVRLASPLVERRLVDAYRSVTADGHRAMTAKACLERLDQTGCEEIDAAVTLRRV